MHVGKGGGGEWGKGRGERGEGSGERGKVVEGRDKERRLKTNT